MKLPYKYRGVVMLGLLIIVLPWAAWSFALRDTFTAWRDCAKLDKQLATTVPQAEVDRPAMKLDEIPEIVLSGLVLDTVRAAAANLSVRVAGYEPLVTLQQDGMAVHTAQLVLTGSYAALLQVVGELEHALPQCRLRTLAWHSATDRQTRRTQLTLTLYMQQIILKK